MKGYVFDIKRFAIHDGPGIRTTVFFTGCPLRCWWCHNPESLRKITDGNIKIINPEEPLNCLIQADADVIEYTPAELFTEIIKDQMFYEESEGGVTFSGGEPLSQADFLNEVLMMCKSNDISTVVDTSGQALLNDFAMIYNNVDKFLYDVKIADDELHKKFTGITNKKIIDNLKWLTEQGDKVIIRIPLIPDITDTEKNLMEITDIISSLKNIDKIDLLPYNRLSEVKYKKLNKKQKLGEVDEKSEEKLNKIRNLFSVLNVEVNIRG